MQLRDWDLATACMVCSSLAHRALLWWVTYVTGWTWELGARASMWVDAVGTYKGRNDRTEENLRNAVRRPKLFCELLFGKLVDDSDRIGLYKCSTISYSSQKEFISQKIGQKVL